MTDEQDVLAVARLNLRDAFRSFEEEVCDEFDVAYAPSSIRERVNAIVIAAQALERTRLATYEVIVT